MPRSTLGEQHAWVALPRAASKAHGVDARLARFELPHVLLRGQVPPQGLRVEQEDSLAGRAGQGLAFDCIRPGRLHPVPASGATGIGHCLSLGSLNICHIASEGWGPLFLLQQPLLCCLILLFRVRARRAIEVIL